MNKHKKSRFKSKAIEEVVVEPIKSNIPTWLPLILVVVALLVYSNTFKNGFVLDDNSAIQSNYIVQKGAKAIPEIFSTEYRAGYWVARGNLYRPVSLAVFACLWDISPNDPFPGHVLNCLLYALTAFFLFRFLVILSGDRNGLFSFLVSLIYIVHPLHTEVVANIKSLDEILSFLFLLLTGILLMNYQRQNIKWMLLLAPFTYMLALMSKESAITFLAVYPLLIYFMPDSKRQHYFATLVTTCFTAGVYLLIRNAVLNSQHGEPYHLLLIDNSLVGAKDFMEKSASAFVLLGKYLWMQIWPYPLCADYSYNQIPLVHWNDLYAILSLCAYLALAALVVIRIRKKELWILGIAIYLIAISLYSNLIITIGTNFGERLAYLPSLGSCITLISGLTFILNKSLIQAREFKAAMSSIKLVLPFVLIISVVAGSYAHIRNNDWKNYFSIYYDVHKAPDSARLNYWYGLEVMKVKAVDQDDPALKQQYYDTTMVYLNKAIQIHPDYGDAYASRGLLYYRLGKMNEAEADYKQAARLKVAQWGMYSNLAIIYATRMMNEPDSTKRRDLFNEAMKNLNFALQVDTRPATIYKNMANLYHSVSMFPEAITKYKEALDHMSADSEKLIPEINRCLEECYRLSGDSANAKLYRSKF